MNEIIWRFIAKQMARPAVADWIIRRAQRTPYDHLTICAGSVRRVHGHYRLSSLEPTERWYMRRWWLLRIGPLRIRVHHILAADAGRDMHDHPWPFRTFVLRGAYLEQRRPGKHVHTRRHHAGQTYRMERGQFHRIDRVSRGGAWTMFMTWGDPKGWGFKRSDGQVIPHQEYES